MTTRISIPRLLDDLLKKDQTLYGGVQATLASFGELLNRGEMVFFPEYTDHSEVHVQDVLDTIDELIPQAVWEKNLLTPQDSATILLSTLVHDLAMKLTEDGFVMLRDGHWSPKPDKRFGDKPWPRLWDEFIHEARRFDGHTNSILFGSPKSMRRPPDSPDNWTKKDRLLIGEFIRRHHPRLAHEFTMHGFPGVQCSLQFNQAIPEAIRDIAGLIARSHGMNLRSCIEAAIEPERRRIQNGVHIPYLMVLLRIADYLQIQSNRASSLLFDLRTLRSAISNDEWNKHFSVDDISKVDDDPESIRIFAKPRTAKIYVLLTKLFADIQKELDTSWAVLGEIYGRFKDEGLDRLGIKFRRIRSNLDDAGKFADKVSFVPRHLRLRTNDAELLKLLVKPLYNNLPQYGIRELMQNSVDAVRELEDYLRNHPKPSHFELHNQDADIVINIEESAEEGGGWLTITDNGVGMMIDTVNDYFLTAGASFRQSDIWIGQHTDGGQSRVLRSGRFGIGVLASFLLGDEVKVTTRHVNSKTGLEFSFTIEGQYIEAKRTSAPIGTTISIRISNNTMETLIGGKNKEDFGNSWNEEVASWDWYAHPTPSILRNIPENYPQISNFVKPLPNDQHLVTPEKYNEIHHPNYRNVRWNWWLQHDVCNGIKINCVDNPEEEIDIFSRMLPHTKHFLFNGDKLSFDIRRPRIDISDPDGNLPLNLQRTKVIEDRLPFREELLEDICKDFIAYCLVNAPEISPWSGKLCPESRSGRYPGLSNRSFSRNDSPRLFGYCAEGTFYLDMWLTKQLEVKELIVLPNEDDGIQLFCGANSYRKCALLFHDYKLNDSDYPGYEDNLADWLAHATGGRRKLNTGFEPLLCFVITGTCMILDFNIDYTNNPSSSIIQDSSSFTSFLYEGIEDYWKEEPSIEKLGKYQILTNGIGSKILQNFHQFYHDVKKAGLTSAMLLQVLPKELEPEKPSPIAKAWEKYLKIPYIPFEDQRARRKRFSDAYKALSRFIDAWKKRNPLHPK